MKFAARPLLLALAVFSTVSAARACYLVVAGREATADGSVMIAHNEDNGTDKVFRFRRVERRVHEPGDSVDLHAGGRLEQADTTWAYVVWEMPGMHFSHGMVNEHQVAVVSNACPSREDSPELTDGGIGPMLRWLVAERSRTARQGAELVGRLVERFGYSASGRTLTIADPREAWQVAMVNGKKWVARRVPDDEVAVLANSYGIHRVDMADTANFMGSGDLKEYAISRGWYDPAIDGEFDFERAYGRLDRIDSPDQRLRQWTGFRRFTGADFPVPQPKQSLPFSVVPAEKVTLRQMFAALRDHYEGTAFAADDCIPHDTPCGDDPRTVCIGSTNHGDVFQLRADEPEPLKAVWWYSFWRPCTAPFVPLYPVGRGLPEGLSFEVRERVFTDPGSGEMPGRDKAIGIFRDLALEVDSRWESAGSVRERWAEFERAQAKEVHALEEEVARKSGLSRAEISRDLGQVNSHLLDEAMRAARELLGEP